MNTETVFLLSNAFVLPAWVLLFFFSRHRITEQIVYSGLWPFLLALMYLGALIVALTQHVALDFSSLDAIKKLFSTEWGVITGWIHYLCFDLLVGIWIRKHSIKYSISSIVVLPSLIFTFLLGPIGWSVYLMNWYLRKK